MTGTDEIRARLSLTEVIEADLGPGKVVGQWRRWRCPFHADKSPSLAVGPEDRTFTCFGCGESGDVFTWLQRRRGLSFPAAKAEAAALAGVPLENAGNRAVSRSASPPARAAEPEPAPEPDPPSQQWQEASWEFVARCQRQLWDEAEGEAIALPYLAWRGLADATIARAGLGWCPGAVMMGGKWGLETGRRVVLHRGIVIPLTDGGHLWGVKTRVFGAQDPETGGGAKYRHLPGGGDVWPYGLDLCRGRDELLILEGEFDRLLAAQELESDVDTMAMKTLKPYVLPTLQRYTLVMAAYDRDAAGARFGESLQRVLPGACLISVPVEEAKADVTAFYQRGGDLALWLAAHRTRCRGAVGR